MYYLNFGINVQGIESVKTSNYAYENIITVLEIEPYTVHPDYTKILNVPYFKQLEGHFCGPASIQQILMYYNGVAPSQYVIAEHIRTSAAGTDMTRIAPYLVEKTGKSYNLYPIGEFLSYRTNIINNFKIDKPMIIGIKTKSGVQWPYQTDGHFLVVSGISLRNQIGRI